MTDNLSVIKSEAGAVGLRTILFDIETGPLDRIELSAMMPTEWPLGNVKDPEKVKAAIAAKEKAWLEDAALDALTGRVLAIGTLEAGRFECLADDDEPALLRKFWAFVQSPESGLQRIIGFNCNSFDLPFLVRRSWKHRIALPLGLREVRYWGREVVDLRDVWQCGDRTARGSLATIAAHLGIGSKIGSGLDFAALWIVDKKKALEYLNNDLILTQKIAHRLGII
jgi:hypothetical protein